MLCFLLLTYHYGSISNICSYFVSKFGVSRKCSFFKDIYMPFSRYILPKKDNYKIPGYKKHSRSDMSDSTPQCSSTMSYCAFFNRAYNYEYMF